MVKARGVAVRMVKEGFSQQVRTAGEGCEGLSHSNVWGQKCARQRAQQVKRQIHDASKSYADRQELELEQRAPGEHGSTVGGKATVDP